MNPYFGLGYNKRCSLGVGAWLHPEEIPREVEAECLSEGGMVLFIPTPVLCVFKLYGLCKVLNNDHKY